VWKNLQAIFSDIDAGGRGLNTAELADPLERLRHLLDMHTQLLDEEHDLRKAHLGLLVEAGWHLHKLRDLEGLMTQTEHTHLDPPLSSSDPPPSDPPPSSEQCIELSQYLRQILRQESTGFKLVPTTTSKT